MFQGDNAILAITVSKFQANGKQVWQWTLPVLCQLDEPSEAAKATEAYQLRDKIEETVLSLSRINQQAETWEWCLQDDYTGQKIHPWGHLEHYLQEVFVTITSQNTISHHQEEPNTL